MFPGGPGFIALTLSLLYSRLFPWRSRWTSASNFCLSSWVCLLDASLSSLCRSWNMPAVLLPQGLCTVVPFAWSTLLPDTLMVSPSASSVSEAFPDHHISKLQLVSFQSNTPHSPFLLEFLSKSTCWYTKFLNCFVCLCLFFLSLESELVRKGKGFMTIYCSLLNLHNDL